MLPINRLVPHVSRRSLSTIPTPGLYELRSYTLHPSGVDSFTALCTTSAPLRKSMLPLRLFTLPETGGMLNVAQHLYYYPTLAARTAARTVSGASPEWKSFVNTSREFVAKQDSTLYQQAPQAILDAGGAPGGQWVGCEERGIYEYRRYRLKLGYDTVPAFYELYEAGLPSKTKNQHDGTMLTTVMHSDIGVLNEVIEIWRHESLEGMEQSRVMAREAGEWREAIGEIAKLAVQFQNSVHRPVSFSPWK